MTLLGHTLEVNLSLIGGVGVAVTQQEIESWLWEAATILRGPVDSANLRDFVFPLLFLKRLNPAMSLES